ncbi:MAG: hypothetical protein K2G03_06040 [Bacilli bacterium]|nr:hypothetical protein [Bacilli bacterium]
MSIKERQLNHLDVAKKEYKLYLLLLKNYALSKESTKEFLAQFNLNDESEIVPYILNPENGYELSKYGHRHEKIRAYNGFRSLYQTSGPSSYNRSKTTRSYK